MRSYKNNHKLAFLGFIAPAMILFSIFFLIPLILTFLYSFTKYDGYKVMTFIGFKNYFALFKDEQFFSTLVRTAVYTIVNLPFKIVIPLILALLGTSPYLKNKSIFRVFIYVPVLLSALIVGLTMNWMFSQEYGLVNYIIQLFGEKPLEWSLNPYLATSVISIASNWASAGFYMVIFIGGINNIPHEIYEASLIDGANGWKKFWNVTFPLLKPTTFLVLLLSTINLLKEYTIIQGITLGGPGMSTTYIIQYIYDKGFNEFDYGYASAVSMVAVVIFAIVSAVQFKISKGGEIE